MILDEAEAIDHYRGLCEANKLNRFSRKDHLYELYPFSSEDSAIIRSAANKVEMMKDVTVVILHPSSDAGFPHTRPKDCVCLQPRWIRSELLPTLIHESIHVHQRREPAFWEAIARKEGWEPISEEEVPGRWRERCRINPDTMMCPFWTWKTHHVPLPLFRGEKPTLADVDIQWWDRRTDSLFKTPPKSFIDKYGEAPSQPEHPYELLAVECAKKGILTISDMKSFLQNR